MITVICRKCGKSYDTDNLNQVLCNDCQNIIRKCNTDNYIFIRSKFEPKSLFRAVEYLKETGTVVFKRSDITSDAIGLTHIHDVVVGCSECDPTGSHTDKKAFLAPPNILSPEKRLKQCSGFKFCPYCGREL